MASAWSRRLKAQGHPLQPQRQGHQPNYIEVARALEGVKADAVIDGELVALDKAGVSHFQLLQNALRSKAKLQYCAFDLMFCDGEDLRNSLAGTQKAPERDITET